ncbi:hydroxyacid dehydrogenase [Herbaspirillum sp. ST 5-3]|uniref:hydroxyacid dehydrogenase n=1 Tax=Oxalobacteraceae TaxID=75682 RepID=UPI0010A2F8BB|nr:hydroxyacid dehydrogenase [Herbaspirillum sp. ST 5-3]
MNTQIKTVLVVGQIHPAGMEVLQANASLKIEVISDPGAAIPVSSVEAADAVLIRYGVMTEAHIANATKLRVVSRHGVGCDNLPVDALSERNIPVTVVGPVNAVSVAEQAMAMMLALSKKLVGYDQSVRKGAWGIRDSLAATELSGKTLLLLGFGRIGREVAKRARAFDMNVLVFDPMISAERAAAEGVVKVEDWRGELGRVDVLSLHLPLTKETRGIVNDEVLGAMRATAIILNTARGGLIDEHALHRALTGRMAFGGAGIDTFEKEPPTLDHPFMALPNVILSPHSAALTEEAAKRMGMVAAQNVVAGLENRLNPDLIFNRHALKM